MLPPDEIVQWSDVDIEIAIASNLPPGTEFACVWDNLASCWTTSAVNQQSDHLLWATSNVDRRLALYEAYGIIWVQTQPKPDDGSIWSVNTPRPTRSSVTQQILNTDPADLDPIEVASVYETKVVKPSNGD